MRIASPSSAHSGPVMDQLESRTFLSAGGGEVAALKPVKAEAGAVFAPDAKVAGKTISQWSQDWWRWAYSYSIDNNSPFLDGVGATEAEQVPTGLGDMGGAYFLAGAIGVNYVPGQYLTANREVTVPSGTPIFFPVLNCENSLFEAASDHENWGTPLAEDADDLWSIVHTWPGYGPGDSPTGMEVRIDNTVLGQEQVLARRTPGSPDGFYYTLPHDHVMTLNGYPQVPEGETLTTLAVTDGWWIMTKPLSVGKHTIEFKGGDPDFFALDVTYTINVVPQGQYKKMVKEVEPWTPLPIGTIFSPTPIAPSILQSDADLFA